MVEMNEKAFLIEGATEMVVEAIQAFRNAGNEEAAKGLDTALNQHAREAYQRVIARAQGQTVPPPPD